MGNGDAVATGRMPAMWCALLDRFASMGPPLQAVWQYQAIRSGILP